MVNSGSFCSDGDRNARAGFTQPHKPSDCAQSSSPVTSVATGTCNSDFSQTADGDEPSAIEPMPTKKQNSNACVEKSVKNDTPDEDDGGGVCCSLPLDKVQGVLTTYERPAKMEDAGAPRAKQQSSSPRKLLCLYCERTFVSANLRQKHVERIHSAKQKRRFSSRRQNQLTVTPCIYCDKLNTSEHTLNELFHHLVQEHSDKYFGCVPCEDRFLSSPILTDHNDAVHQFNVIKSETPPLLLPKVEEIIVDSLEELKEVPVKVTRSKMKSRTEEDPLTVENNVQYKKPMRSDGVNKKKNAKLKDVRSKKLTVNSSKIALKRSKRLEAQVKEVESQKRKREKRINLNKTEGATAKQAEKSKTVISSVNPYPEFDNFYRVKKITDHSIDNLKISSLTFDDVFDKAFFNRIKCNIEENLLHHIDGKLFKNEESENRISNFEKISILSQEPQNSNSENYGCEISLNAVTPVAALSLNSQFGEDFESQIEYGSKPSKKKVPQTRKDEVHYKYFTRRKYQASILQQKENRDLSKLDMWTQLVIKKRQQKMLNDKKSAREIMEYTSGEEYKSQIRREELNRILDRRGPFEDLKEEATKKAALDKLNSTLEIDINEEAFLEVREVLNSILNRVFEITEAANSDIKVPAFINRDNDHREIPAYLNLRKTSSLPSEGEIDVSDKITLICSSQETENFELPTNSARGKNEMIELTGEWARCRMFVCAACGCKLPNIKYLLEHKSVYHQNVWVQHYEFVGNQSELYRHLSIPGLGKVGEVEESVQCKFWRRSTARICTKCGKQCNSLGELHRHILECGEDWTWMLARKKCKYRPFGAKSRRKRRGLVHRVHQQRQKAEPSERKVCKKSFDGPRQRPSDADTIQRMLANLPAKRLRRNIISLQDVIFKSRTNKKTNISNTNSNKIKCGKAVCKKQHADKCTTNVNMANIANMKSQRNMVGGNSRSLRSLNKVLSSRILDTNSSLIVKRKMKALNEKRITRQSQMEQANTSFDVEDEDKFSENLDDETLKSNIKQKSKKANASHLVESKSKNNIENMTPATTKRMSPRSVSKTLKKRITVKQILSSKMNIKNFFPVKKRKNMPIENETKSNLPKTKKSCNNNNIKIVEDKPEQEKTKKSGFKKLLRTLTVGKIKKKGACDQLSTTADAGDSEKNESQITETDTDFTNVSFKKKQKPVVEGNKNEPETNTDECLEDGRVDTKPIINNVRKRKLRQSVRSVIDKVKKLKIDNTAKNEKPPITSVALNNNSNSHLNIFLEKETLAERVVSPLETKDATNKSVPVPIAINYSEEDPPIPETIFNLDSNNEKNLQAKGELDFDKHPESHITSLTVKKSQIEQVKESESTNNEIVTKEIDEHQNAVDKLSLISIEISEKPKDTPLISPNMKGKMRKQTRGLNDCIAMLTSKLQQKEDVPVHTAQDKSVTSESLSEVTSQKSLNTTEVHSHVAKDSRLKPKKPECILKIPTFKITLHSNAGETALDLSKKSSSCPDLAVMEDPICPPYMQPNEFNILESINTIDRVIEDVIEHKCKEVLSEKLRHTKWTSVDDIIQQVIDSYAMSQSEKISSTFNRSTVDDTIDFVVSNQEQDESIDMPSTFKHIKTLNEHLNKSRKLGASRKGSNDSVLLTLGNLLADNSTLNSVPGFSVDTKTMQTSVESPVPKTKQEIKAVRDEISKIFAANITQQNIIENTLNLAFIKPTDVISKSDARRSHRKLGTPRDIHATKVRCQNISVNQSRTELIEGPSKRAIIETDLDKLFDIKEIAVPTDSKSKVNNTVIDAKENNISFLSAQNEDEPFVMENKNISMEIKSISQNPGNSTARTSSDKNIIPNAIPQENKTTVVLEQGTDKYSRDVDAKVGVDNKRLPIDVKTAIETIHELSIPLQPIQLENEPIIFENKTLIVAITKDDSKVSELQGNVSSDSEDEIPLASLLKQADKKKSPSKEEPEGKCVQEESKCVLARNISVSHLTKKTKCRVSRKKSNQEKRICETPKDERKPLKFENTGILLKKSDSLSENISAEENASANSKDVEDSNAVETKIIHRTDHQKDHNNDVKEIKETLVNEYPLKYNTQHKQVEVDEQEEIRPDPMNASEDDGLKNCVLDRQLTEKNLIGKTETRLSVIKNESVVSTNDVDNSLELSGSESIKNDHFDTVSADLEGNSKVRVNENKVNHSTDDNLKCSKQKTRRKSKSFKKIDKIEDDLFKDFALVINKKAKRIPPTSIVDYSVCDEMSYCTSKKNGTTCHDKEQKSDNEVIANGFPTENLDDSVEEMDMEIDEEISHNTSIIERGTSRTFNYLTKENTLENTSLTNQNSNSINPLDVSEPNASDNTNHLDLQKDITKRTTKNKRDSKETSLVSCSNRLTHRTSKVSNDLNQSTKLNCVNSVNLDDSSLENITDKPTSQICKTLDNINQLLNTNSVDDMFSNCKETLILRSNLENLIVTPDEGIKISNCSQDSKTTSLDHEEHTADREETSGKSVEEISTNSVLDKKYIDNMKQDSKATLHKEDQIDVNVLQITADNIPHDEPSAQTQSPETNVSKEQLSATQCDSEDLIKNSQTTSKPTDLALHNELVKKENPREANFTLSSTPPLRTKRARGRQKKFVSQLAPSAADLWQNGVVNPSRQFSAETLHRNSVHTIAPIMNETSTKIDMPANENLEDINSLNKKDDNADRNNCGGEDILLSKLHELKNDHNDLEIKALQDVLGTIRKVKNVVSEVDPLTHILTSSDMDIAPVIDEIDKSLESDGVYEFMDDVDEQTKSKNKKTRKKGKRHSAEKLLGIVVEDQLTRRTRTKNFKSKTCNIAESCVPNILQETFLDEVSQFQDSIRKDYALDNSEVGSKRCSIRKAKAKALKNISEELSDNTIDYEINTSLTSKDETHEGYLDFIAPKKSKSRKKPIKYNKGLLNSSTDEPSQIESTILGINEKHIPNEQELEDCTNMGNVEETIDIKEEKEVDRDDHEQNDASGPLIKTECNEPRLGSNMALCTASSVTPKQQTERLIVKCESENDTKPDEPLNPIGKRSRSKKQNSNLISSDLNPTTETTLPNKGTASTDKSLETQETVPGEECGQELRRSRRGSRKVTSYNENDLIDPLIDALEIKRQSIKKDKPHDKNCQNIQPPLRRLNNDELFDLLKSTSTNENIYIPKPQNSFLNNLDDPDSDGELRDDNFDQVFDNILEKSSLIIDKNILNEKAKDVDRIYEFTENSSDNTEQVNLKKFNKSRQKDKLEDGNDASSISPIKDNISPILPKTDTVLVKDTSNPVKDNYCEICNKSFIRVENLIKHKRTLTHISKLSEIEAREAEEKARLEQRSPIHQEVVMEISHSSLKSSDSLRDEINITDILQQSEKPHLQPPKPQTSFTNNDSLKLADIINDVLNKPVLENLESEKPNNFCDRIIRSDSPHEYRRYKSLGERKSFESDKPIEAIDNPPITDNYFEQTLSKTTILEKQISLLENIIENQTGHANNYIDISLSSDTSVAENNTPGDNSETYSVENAEHSGDNIQQCPSTEESFIKPAAHYEEISEDSINQRSYEDQKLRKTLNRDEELFLECCSLLKSSSEVSNYSKNSKALRNTESKQNSSSNWMDRKILNQVPDHALEYCNNSRMPTPLGDTYDDEASNSNTISSNWNLKRDLKNEDVDSLRKSITFEEVLHSELIIKNEDDNSERSATPDFGEMLSKAANHFSFKTEEKKKITDKYAHSPAVEEKKEDSDSSSNDSKMVITKGARKVYEGLKVSIPTNELNLEEVLNGSLKTKHVTLLSNECPEELKDASIELDSPTKPPRPTRKSKPVKNSQIGSNLLFKINKKKVSPSKRSNEDTDQKCDIYDFEETQDNTQVFTKPIFKNIRNTNKGFLNKYTESDNDSQGYSDSIGAEAQSISSISSLSTGYTPTKTSPPENITKKKCMIMGRIFKNCAKSKVDFDEDMRTIPEINNSELVENYVLNCAHQTENTEEHGRNDRPNQGDPPKKKLSEKELDMLFDNLLEGKFEDKNENKLSPNNKTELKSEIKKKSKVKARKRNRTSESSDDEFNLSKTAKKRSNRKTVKEEDNCINLEQELRECIGVASRKSQRKCTSGKQNVLVEYWSSDEEAFEAMLESKKLESKICEDVPALPTIQTDIVHRQNADCYKKESIPSLPNTTKTIQKKKSSVDKKKQTDKPKQTPTVASNRRKRAAANPLYHWSSSSEDESQNLIEVKPIRDELEVDDRPVQHGWIVGDSPKKLVTMLALTKGKKSDVDCVKEQNKRRTTVS